MKPELDQKASLQRRLTEIQARYRSARIFGAEAHSKTKSLYQVDWAHGALSILAPDFLLKELVSSPLSARLGHLQTRRCKGVEEWRELHTHLDTDTLRVPQEQCFVYPLVFAWQRQVAAPSLTPVQDSPHIALYAVPGQRLVAYGLDPNVRCCWTRS